MTRSRYKLVKGDVWTTGRKPYNGYNGWNGSATPNPVGVCTARPCLFDMSSDVAEKHDLADKLPAVLAQLVARYSQLRESEVSLKDSGLCPAHVPAVDGCRANAASGVWAPWL